MTGKTLRKSVALRGLSVLGRAARVRLGPGRPGTGILFNHHLKADILHACVVGHSTVLGGRGRRVRMVEHLLAACLGMDVWNLEVDAPDLEVPVLDGSSQPFVRAFSRAGLVGCPAPESLAVDSPVVVQKRAGFLAALPSPRLRVHCLVDFAEVGAQSFSAAVTGATFCSEIAPARTFMLTRWSPGRVQRALRLRFGLKRVGRFVVSVRERLPAELCRHKVLDLLGDLMLLGRPLRAEVFAFRPSHSLNHAFVRTLRSRTEAR